MIRHETWAEQDLDRYLESYAKGSDETERRKRTCAVCGDDFDRAEGKELTLYMDSPIKIRGKRPNSICICNYCLQNAEDIEGEEDYE